MRRSGGPKPACLLLALAAASTGAWAQAQPDPRPRAGDADAAPAAEGVGEAAAGEGKPAKKHSPWLFVPLVSSNPKLGSSLGVMVGYVTRFDATSEPSMLALMGQRSNTKSTSYGLGGKAFWNDNAHQLQFGVGGGNVTNDYLDFLGTGQEVRSDETLRAYFLRYQRRVRPNWYFGGQALYSNYAVEGSDMTSEQILDQAGLAGSVVAGLGLVGSYDTRDNTNNPTEGMQLLINNFLFRDSFGSDDDYEQAIGQLQWYHSTSDRNVVVVHSKLRWTNGAPASKQSPVELRGYTRGQYLGRNAVTIEAEDRYMFRPRWGAKVFAGASCLFGDGEDCSGDNVYPMVGTGVFYVLKPESNMVMAGEFAKGNGDNRGFYLTFGHRF